MFGPRPVIITCVCPSCASMTQIRYLEGKGPFIPPICTSCAQITVPVRVQTTNGSQSVEGK